MRRKLFWPYHDYGKIKLVDGTVMDSFTIEEDGYCWAVVCKKHANALSKSGFDVDEQGGGHGVCGVDGCSARHADEMLYVNLTKPRKGYKQAIPFLQNFKFSLLGETYSTEDMVDKFSTKDCESIANKLNNAGDFTSVTRNGKTGKATRL